MVADQQSTPDPVEHIRLQDALRESEILRELAELLASSLDLEHILNVLVRRTTQVCEVQRCAVWLLEDERGTLRPQTYQLSSPTLDRKTIKAADALWYRSVLPVDDPVVQRLLHSGGMLYLQDLRAEPSMKHLADTFLVRSMLLIALIREGRPVGLLTLDDPAQARSFTPKQLQLARAIGQQAAVAIDNARLYRQAQTESRRAERLIERLRSIYQVALAVNASEDLSTVFRLAMDNLVRALGADGGAIALIEGEELHVVSSHFGQIPPNVNGRIPLAHLPNCHHIAVTGLPLYVKEEEIEGEEILFYRQVGLRNTIIVPMIVSASAINQHVVNETRLNTPDRCVGLAFVNFYTHTFQPTGGQIAYAQDIAAQCALAVEKFRLLAEMRESAVEATGRATTLDAIFHAMSEGITVSDMQGNVIVLNNAASHFLGIPRNYRNQLNSFLRRYPTYTVEGRPMADDEFPLTRALRGERIRAERFVTRRADGEERILEVNIAPMHDSQGEQIGLVSAFRDVTEAIRGEQRIRQALDTMLHVAEAVSGVTDVQAILRTVLERTLTTLNCDQGGVQIFDEKQQKFVPLLTIGFGVEDEAQWLKDQQVWLEPQPEAYAGFYRQVMDGHATLINAEQHPYQPDPLAHVMVLAAPIKHNGRVHGLLLLDRSLPRPAAGASVTSSEAGQQERHEFSIWDIAVLEGIAQLAGLAVDQALWQQEAFAARNSEAALREANQSKDDFMAITAHEFRTPLTVILAQSQLIAKNLTPLQKEAAGTSQTVLAKATTNLGIIGEQARYLTGIVEAFLEASQIASGQLALSTPVDVDLAAIAREVIEQSSTTNAEHTITCIIEDCDRPYLVKGDRTRLRQVIANLVENAIKYSPFGGPVTLKMRRCFSSQREHLIEVCVDDKGIGIPPEALPRLFERFYRAPNTTHSNAKGVGLGLFLVAQLLHLHGGEIRAESSGMLGEGSRFVFTLPALEGTDSLA
jgi:PAS domain S-box-containing protein